MRNPKPSCPLLRRVRRLFARHDKEEAMWRDVMSRFDHVLADLNTQVGRLESEAE